MSGVERDPIRVPPPWGGRSLEELARCYAAVLAFCREVRARLARLEANATEGEEARIDPAELGLIREGDALHVRPGGSGGPLLARLAVSTDEGRFATDWAAAVDLKRGLVTLGGNAANLRPIDGAGDQAAGDERLFLSRVPGRVTRLDPSMAGLGGTRQQVGFQRGPVDSATGRMRARFLPGQVDGA